MRNPHEFDEFYTDTRERVLLETYALTGDVVSSRSAVRDAYASAWHHWRRVSRLDDKESWLRPVAWRRAQRRTTARLRNRTAPKDPQNARTIAALRGLSSTQRRALLLAHLSPLTMREIARDVALPQPELERVLQQAASAFSVAREVPAATIGQTLRELRTEVAGTRWPLESVVRRNGAERRTIYTAGGVLGSVMMLLVAGAAVSPEGAAVASLRDEEWSQHQAVRKTPKPEIIEVQADDLLSASAVTRLAPAMTWTEKDTNPNTDGDGLVLPCQAERFADTTGRQALVRTFSGEQAAPVATKPAKPVKPVKKGNKPVPVSSPRTATAWEFVELSSDEASATNAFQTALGWYAGCVTARVTLTDTHTVTGVGDEAMAFSLLDWSGKRPRAIAVAVSRSGSLLLTTAARVPGVRSPLKAGALTLASAVNRLCRLPESGGCAGPPSVSAAPALPAGTTPTMLSEFDLPPVANATGPWVGTEPMPGQRGIGALSTCDRTDFTTKGVRNVLSRTYLFPETKGSLEFGLTQVTAQMPPTLGHQFVVEARKKVTSCAAEGFGTTVRKLREVSEGALDVSVWQLDVEISDSRKVTYMTALMRRGRMISQLVFVPSKTLTLSSEQFERVVERAEERLQTP